MLQASIYNSILYGIVYILKVHTFWPTTSNKQAFEMSVEVFIFSTTIDSCKTFESFEHSDPTGVLF